MEGKCGKVVCDEFGIQHNKCNSMTFFTTVSARSLAELCDTLASPSLNAPVNLKINSVKRYSRPMFKDQTDPEQCNVLDDFEFCHVPECMDYCEEEVGSASVQFANLISNHESNALAQEFDPPEGQEEFVKDLSGSSEPLVANAQASAEVLALGYEYSGDSLAESMAPASDSVSMCGCRSVPLSLEMSHSLGRSSEISRFLRSNSLSLPDSIRMNYRSFDNLWHHVTHLGSSEVSRTVSFGLSCDSNLWKFYFVVKQNDKQTKLMLDLPHEIICFSGRMSFVIEVYFKSIAASVAAKDKGKSFDVITPKRLGVKSAISEADAYANGIFVPNLVYYDGLGLFVDDFWERSPLRIQINSRSTSPSTLMTLEGIV